MSDTATKRCHDGVPVDRRTRRPVSALIPVHLLGHPADLDALHDAVAGRRVAVVEDAAQALGATYCGRPVRSGGVAAVSFNANKIITTGGGGAILTDDDQMAARARYLINQAREHPAEYRHGELGYNYRLSNLAAAIGCAQMERLGSFVEAKRHIHTAYAEGLSDIPGLTFQNEARWAHATRWFTTIAVDPHAYGATAGELRDQLAGHGIQTGPAWTPLHQTGAHCSRTLKMRKMNATSKARMWRCEKTPAA